MTEAQMIPFLWVLAGVALVVILAVVRSVAREMSETQDEDEKLRKEIEKWRAGK